MFFFLPSFLTLALFSQISWDSEGRRGCLPHAKRCPFRQLSALMLSMCRCCTDAAWLLESTVVACHAALVLLLPPVKRSPHLVLTRLFRDISGPYPYNSSTPNYLTMNLLSLFFPRWSCCCVWIELLESLVFEVAHHRTSLVCFQCSCTLIFKEIRAWLDEENNWEDYARTCWRLEENGWLMSRLSIRSELRPVDFELNIHPSSFARFPDCWRESLEWNFIP